VRCEEGVPCDSSTIGWIVMHRVCGCAAGGAAVPRYTVLSSERCTRDDTDRGVPAHLARADTPRSGRCVRRPRCRPAHIDHGRLVSAGSIADLVPATAGTVVTTPDTDALTAALRATGATVERSGIDRLTVTNVSAAVIGRAAVDAGAVILGMRAEGDDLAAIFENLIHPKERVS